MRITDPGAGPIGAAGSAQAGKGAYRPRAEANGLHRNRGERELLTDKLCEPCEVFDDQDVPGEQL